MQKITGYTNAKKVLNRRLPAEDFEISAGLKQALKGMFGTESPEEAVMTIIGRVRERGDEAIRELGKQIDGISLKSLEITSDEIKKAYAKTSLELVTALKLAAGNIRVFHEDQKEAMWHGTTATGLTQQVRPLARVGLYAPGGTAAYPSTVLMTAVPAKVAGVGEVILATPAAKDAHVPAATLVAADIAGVDRVYSIGGAQAIAALAYGTETVPAVDKICGPGNIFVVLAKKAVFGTVDIDGLHGPSEVLIIADETTLAEYAASELLAQAEHDTMARTVLVTVSADMAGEIKKEISKQIGRLSRRTVIEESLENCVLAVVESSEEACALANIYAPEHLCIISERAADYARQITNAGCIVTGRGATVALGDYAAGPSHVLPTGGTARFASPLNILDFLKITSVIDTDKFDITEAGNASSVIARAEGLDAHAQAVERRLTK
ncbi:histidinol dehydrogenase [Chloroflexota bacterium]